MTVTFVKAGIAGTSSVCMNLLGAAEISPWRVASVLSRFSESVSLLQRAFQLCTRSTSSKAHIGASRYRRPAASVLNTEVGEPGFRKARIICILAVRSITPCARTSFTQPCPKWQLDCHVLRKAFLHTLRSGAAEGKAHQHPSDTPRNAGIQATKTGAANSGRWEGMI
jgi:hypothetical protein